MRLVVADQLLLLMRQSQDPGTYQTISNLVFEGVRENGGSDIEDAEGTEMNDTSRTLYQP